MNKLRAIRRLLNREDGHATTVPGLLLAAAGAIVLAIGAANDTDVVTIIGGVMLAAGIVAESLLNHMKVDYEIYDRLNELEKS